MVGGGKKSKSKMESFSLVQKLHMLRFQSSVAHLAGRTETIGEGKKEEGRKSE